MIEKSVERVTSLFHSGFFIAYWGPLLLAFLEAGLIITCHVGAQRVQASWDRLASGQQILLGLGAVLALTLLSLVLHSLTGPIVRCFEGYWRERFWNRWLVRRLVARQNRLRQSARESIGQPLVAPFPVGHDRLLPTRLGNALRAAEDHPSKMYGLPGVTWWARLAVRLPDRMLANISASLTPMVALLNVSALIGVVGVLGGASLFLQHYFRHEGYWIATAIILVSAYVSWIAYQAAVEKARDYGLLFRTAYDLHRMEILKALRIPVPKSDDEERRTWKALTRWISDGGRPSGTYPSKLKKPLFLDEEKLTYASTSEVGPIKQQYLIVPYKKNISSAP
jgi:hypothetical protein